MKKNLLYLGIVVLCITFSSTLFSKEINEELSEIAKNVPIHFIPTPNLDQIHKEDAERAQKGILHRMGVASSVNLNTTNAGAWITLSSGEKKWQLIIQNPGAEALSFIFKTFKLSHGSLFWVQNKAGEKMSKVFTNEDMLEDFQQNVALCYGDELVLTLIDQPNSLRSELVMDRVFYNYRSTGNLVSKNKINESDVCEVNVNCSEGTNYQDEKRGVALVYIIEGQSAGYCSGSLVNNLAQDCKPLFLTALHCGVSTTANDMALWKFYFNYEALACPNPTAVGTLFNHYITSCVRLADSADKGGDTGSDFLLLQLGTLANQTATINNLRSASINAYWNGWDANSTANTGGGVGIHHPSGDIKKISTYSVTPTSSSFGGKVQNTHWDLTWAGTTNGHGITEEGSSGSPLFSYNNGSSRIIGTLTGGSTYCNALTAHDEYGKVSYHWQSNGATSNKRLSTYLDPANTGVKVLNGSSNPCTRAGIESVNTNEKLKIYPNPTSDKLSIDLSSFNDKEIVIDIIDLSGKLISTSTKIGGTTVDLEMSQFTKGLYHIRIHTENGLIVQKVSKL